ncbi:MAG: nucleotidyl transferase AbiEii/AbiGii toxin family protein [Syntrophales bacterium]|nr:nucleotidyl transferase AbiEii/AbiGii toxin family protein [Syntrophales bacterium]
MNSFVPQMEILSLSQQRVWSSLTSLCKARFVLYGGTAIALRLGHRQSIDFDFFSDQPLDKSMIYKMLPILADATVIQDTPDSLGLLVPIDVSAVTEYVKLSFFGNIDNGRVSKPEMTADGVMVVASLPDMMAHKLKVILQRIQAKDYRDIAAMLKYGMRLDEGMAGACALFGKTFQPSESLKALVYFDGGDLDVLSDVERAILVSAVKRVKKIPLCTIRSKFLLE